MTKIWLGGCDIRWARSQDNVTCGMQTSLSHTSAIRTNKEYSTSDELSRGEKDLKGNTIMLSDADEKCIQRSNTVASASLKMTSSANRNHHICVIHYILKIIWLHKFDLSSNMSKSYCHREYCKYKCFVTCIHVCLPSLAANISNHSIWIWIIHVAIGQTYMGTTCKYLFLSIVWKTW